MSRRYQAQNYKQSRGIIRAAAAFGQLEIEPYQGEDHKTSAQDAMRESSKKIRVINLLWTYGVRDSCGCHSHCIENTGPRYQLSLLQLKNTPSRVSARLGREKYTHLCSIRDMDQIGRAHV